MASVLALPAGTVLAEDYRIERVLGMGGFGITYLATEIALQRQVTIKEYFPSEFATRVEGAEAVPRSENSAGDYKWGLDRFIEEAKTLAKFNHPNINRVYRYFRANSTGYIVVHFEEGESLKAWLKGLGRAARQKEIDAILTPLLEALEHIHAADFLHRDIAPDNIIIRKDGSPVLIDFGSARGEIAKQTRTLSALVKPGYSPYEQYSETGQRQGPWTDIYALAATLYHVVSGKRPPDAPSRVVKDDYVPAKDVALSSYRASFLKAIDAGLMLEPEQRPPSVLVWRSRLLAPDPAPQQQGAARIGWGRRGGDIAASPPLDARPGGLQVALEALVPPAPDAPGPKGGFIDFVEALKKPAEPAAVPPAPVAKGSPQAAPPAPPLPPIPAAPAVDRAPVEKPAAVATRKLAQKQKARPVPRVEIQGEPTLSRMLKAARKTPRPRPIRNPSSGRWRSLALKLGIGAAFAGALVYLQTRLPEIVTSSTSVPTSQTAAAGGEVLLLGQLKGHTGGTNAVAYTDDGRTIVTVGVDNQIKIWTAASGTLARSVAFSGGAATTLAISGRRAATGHQDGRVIVWDIDRAEIIATLKRNEAPVWSVAFAGETTKILAASHDWTIVYWDTKNAGQPFHVFEGHESSAQAVAFQPQSGLIASGSADKSVKVWSAPSLSSTRALKGHRDFVVAVTFSPDGKTIASGSLDGTIRLWSATTGNSIRTLSGHKGRVAGLAFSPSGEMLASGGEDGTLRLWDPKRGRTLRVYGGGGPAVKSVAFEPAAKRVAAASDDGTVRLWSAAPPPQQKRSRDDEDE